MSIQASPSPAAPAEAPIRRMPGSAKLNVRDRMLKGFGGNRQRRYLKLAAAGLVVLWLPAVLFVTLSPPQYKCSWTMILPAAGGNANVSLDSIGNATSSTPSPYGGATLSPTANYKAIATSDGLLDVAAEKIGLTGGGFGKPQIKLTDQTSVIDFSIKGETPELARAKAVAFIDALQDQLRRLRADEAKSREGGISENLLVFRQKLEAANAALLAFRMNNDFITVEQFKDLAKNLEQLRQQRAALIAQREHHAGVINALGSQLGVSSEQAAKAMILQNDPLFAKLYSQWSDLMAEHARLTSTMGERHPNVAMVAEQERNIRKQAESRSKKLAGNISDAVLQLVVLAPTDSRTGLFQTMLSTIAEERGLAFQAEQVGREIANTEKRLDLAGQQLAKLDDLTRSQQVAEAVFSSAVARVDVGKSDLYVSYPLLQVLQPPELPQKPDRLAKLLALVGALAGSVMYLGGLALLWVRMPIIRKLSKLL
ncbi:hypothetical protein ABLE93_20750 [Xanthobacter sp. KR7-65]|uniref:GumC family protein n=1 Tax=Xanthobacter sp. KR7-65 TaxID=3156612 RepID=UPI0032B5D4A2